MVSPNNWDVVHWSNVPLSAGMSVLGHDMRRELCTFEASNIR